MSSEEEKKCPLCAEEMDWTDLHFKPCQCGYQVCVWCWHHIIDMAEKDDTEGKCPACRMPYDKEKIEHMQANCERVANTNTKRKHKPAKVTKPKPNEVRTDLANVRVIQREMAYVIGLPLSLADENLLKRVDYFGQYGKVTKVSLSRTAGGTVQEFVNETCSVYITYSKAAEALRCIQSVHGFVLEGRLLRASFGTAKYCHAWLRNRPCNNTSCLYLHSIGAEEDSFGKDEVAAVHTRSRVQQIVGAIHNSQQRAGHVLPPPIDEILYDGNFSTEKSTTRSSLKDACFATSTPGSQLTSLSSQATRMPNKTTFVDVVGRSSVPCSRKDRSKDGRGLNLCPELSLRNIDTDNLVKVDNSDGLPCEFSSCSQLVDRLLWNEEFKEPSNHLRLGRSNFASTDASVIKENFLLTLGPGTQESHGLHTAFEEDQLHFNNEIPNDYRSVCHTTCLFPSSYSAKAPNDFVSHDWQQSNSSSLSDFNADCDAVNSNIHEASIQLSHVNSVLGEGYIETKLGSSAESDRIYRNSNSFSSEEIVEHLRRLGDDSTISDGNSVFEAVENSIISTILSMDLDASDNTSALPHNLAVSCLERGRQPGSYWNLGGTKPPGYSFANQEHFEGQVTDLGSSFDNTSQISEKSRVSCDYLGNKEQFLAKEPPPGFGTYRRAIKFNGISGNHQRTPSTGNASNASDGDFNDPAIMVIERGKTWNESSNSGLEVRSKGYTAQLNSRFEEEAKFLFPLQQSAPGLQDTNLSQILTNKDLRMHPELRCSSHLPNGISSQDEYGIIPSRLVNKHQSYNQPSFPQLSQPRFVDGHILNGYHTGLDKIEVRSQVGITGIEREDRFGLNSCYSGYGNPMFHTPSSGDVYSRMFGL